MFDSIIYPDAENKTPQILLASAPDVRISPLNLSCSEQSPCKTCPRQRSDKNLCSDTCERLKAYQFNQPYEHLPFSRVSDQRGRGRARA